MKTIYIIIIVILLGVVSYLYFVPKPNTDISRFKSKLDSLSTLIKKDKQTIKRLLKDADSTEIKEVEFLKEADSLAKIISTLHLDKDCPRIVEVQGKEITSLRNGLEKCNEAKTIYVKTLGICQDIVITHEIKEITTTELSKALIKDHEKEKKRAFIFGAGAGGLAVLLLLLL